MMMYTFLDPVVSMAYRVPHLSHDMLPPLSDYDYTKNLVRRSFKAGTNYPLAYPLLIHISSIWIPFPVAPKGISSGVS